MLFNSLEFLIFFPTVVCLYYLCPHRFRWALLLAVTNGQLRDDLNNVLNRAPV